jgi:hypothetical protein
MAHCEQCHRQAYSTTEFERQCEQAGFIKDGPTGQFKMRVGELAGLGDQVDRALSRQVSGQQGTFDRLEGQRGYQCVACGNVYCMDCLYAVAPPHPRGGKACPACGATFQHYEGY